MPASRMPRITPLTAGLPIKAASSGRPSAAPAPRPARETPPSGCRNRCDRLTPRRSGRYFADRAFSHRGRRLSARRLGPAGLCLGPGAPGRRDRSARCRAAGPAQAGGAASPAGAAKGGDDRLGRCDLDDGRSAFVPRLQPAVALAAAVRRGRCACRWPAQPLRPSPRHRSGAGGVSATMRAARSGRSRQVRERRAPGGSAAIASAAATTKMPAASANQRGDAATAPARGIAQPERGCRAGAVVVAGCRLRRGLCAPGCTQPSATGNVDAGADAAG